MLGHLPRLKKLLLALRVLPVSFAFQLMPVNSNEPMEMGGVMQQRRSASAANTKEPGGSMDA